MSKNPWHPILEKCGFILKSGEVVEVDNEHEFPTVAFTIPLTTINDYKDEIEVMWHSHPSNSTNLSVEDYKNFLKYPEYIHRIYGYDEVSEYYVRDGVVYLRD